MLVFDRDVVDGALISVNGGLDSNGIGILLDLVRVVDYNDLSAAYLSAVSWLVSFTCDLISLSLISQTL